MAEEKLEAALARNCKKFHFPINSRYSSPVLIKYGIKADVSLQFFISWPQKALNLEKNALKFESRLWIWFEIINYFRMGLVKFMLNLFDIIVFAIVKTFCQIYIIFKKKTVSLSPNLGDSCKDNSVFQQKYIFSSSTWVLYYKIHNLVSITLNNNDLHFILHQVVLQNHLCICTPSW